MVTPRRWTAVAAAFLGGCGGAERDLATVRDQVKARYPDVRQVATADLAAWMADGTRKPPVLLDVREPREFEVSRLAGARNVVPGARWEDALAGIPKDTPIVAYCSVGYRSSALVAKLAAAGWTDVANLDGSIFQWANEGRPLVDGRGPADRVHPYDADWGRLLDERRRARE